MRLQIIYLVFWEFSKIPQKIWPDLARTEWNTSTRQNINKNDIFLSKLKTFSSPALPPWAQATICFCNYFFCLKCDYHIIQNWYFGVCWVEHEASHRDEKNFLLLINNVTGKKKQKKKWKSTFVQGVSWATNEELVCENAAHMGAFKKKKMENRKPNTALPENFYCWTKLKNVIIHD